jgi:hypothetical protein
VHPSIGTGWIAAAAAAAVLAASATAAAPASKTCPSAATVNAALGTHAKGPVVSSTPYSKTCTYSGSGISSPKITFQEDSLAAFQHDEKAVGSLAVNVKGLGQAAWTTNGGSLYVYANGIQYKILALLVATPRLEALARKLI